LRRWYIVTSRSRTSGSAAAPRARALRVIGVLTIPGQIAVTPMPCGRSSSRSASLSPSTANFVAL